jgi:hypothetical protein
MTARMRWNAPMVRTTHHHLQLALSAINILAVVAQTNALVALMGRNGLPIKMTAWMRRQQAVLASGNILIVRQEPQRPYATLWIRASIQVTIAGGNGTAMDVVWVTTKTVMRGGPLVVVMGVQHGHALG